MPIRLLLEHDHAFTPEDVKLLIQLSRRRCARGTLSIGKRSITVSFAAIRPARSTSFSANRG
jgi:hypothetical protein